MDLPLLLPRNLHYYGEVSTEDELLEKLEGHKDDLIVFFEYACDDETWTEAHEKFMQAILRWLSRQAYHDRLSDEIVERAAKSIQKHYLILKSILPLSIILSLGDQNRKVNNLLFGAASPFFREFLTHEWRSRGSNVFIIKDVPSFFIDLLDEYICLGYVKELWKFSPEDIRLILKQALSWELFPFAKECEEVLKRYINRDNIYNTLIQAHLSGWIHLKNACIEYINTLNLGIVIEKSEDPKNFIFEFIHFKENSLDVFGRFKAQITHLIFGGNLVSDPLFNKTINECPNLQGLDLSHLTLFNERILELPSSLKELDLSYSPWLNGEILRNLFQKCSDIERLSLSSNVHLTFSAWPELQKLRRLNSLNLSRCHQITDQELRLITHSCTGLKELILQECTKISDCGFFEMSKSLVRLHLLNLAHTELSNSPLMEIAYQCKNLTHLDISYCQNINDRGALQVVRECSSLRTLNLSHTPVRKETLPILQTMNPSLNILM